MRPGKEAASSNHKPYSINAAFTFSFTTILFRSNLYCIQHCLELPLDGNASYTVISAKEGTLLAAITSVYSDEDAADVRKRPLTL